MATHDHIERVTTVIADKSMLGGAGAGIAGWLTDNNILGLIGVLVALAGFLVNWYYKHKHYKLAERAAGLGADKGQRP